MADEVIRIFSDIHYGDRSSRVERLRALAPLLDGASALIFNGDTLDTRPGPHPHLTAEWRAQADDFFRGSGLPVTLVTGNHDPDISSVHELRLAEDRIYLTHGDILYEDIVPWGKDVALIRERFAQVRRAGTPGTLAARYDELRRVTGSIPQRHQSERRRARYLKRLIADTTWPPWRIAIILAAWRSLPRRARAFASRHSLDAEVIITGHTHWPGIWRSRAGRTVVNTGSLCRPFGGRAIDLAGDRLLVREIRSVAGEFRLGPAVAELRLRTPPR